jgi:uncharacterized protein YabE (DUF348 family)
VKFGLYAAVLAGVIGGTVAWTNADKTVTLVVDGTRSRLHTTANSVADVLRSRGYVIGPHDLVAPAGNASVHDGSTVVLERGRQLRLSVNGVERTVWTTATTVAAALAQLGYATGDYVSVSRAQRLPLTPTDIEVRTPKTVTLVVRGVPHTVTTVDATVRDLFADLGITTTGDVVSVPVSSAIVAGERIAVRHITHTRMTVIRAVPYTRVTETSATLAKGRTRLVTPGQNGKMAISYSEVFVDGKLVAKTLIEKRLVSKPTPQVTQVGTKVTTPKPATPKPAPSPSPAPSSSSAPRSSPPKSHTPPVTVKPGSAKAIAKQLLAARGLGSGQFSCLVSLWDNESGWRVTAENPDGAYGIPQALPGSKMASYGSDWRTDAKTQIEWGLAYIGDQYGTPCGAWSYWKAHGWY